MSRKGKPLLLLVNPPDPGRCTHVEFVSGLHPSLLDLVYTVLLAVCTVAK